MTLIATQSIKETLIKSKNTLSCHSGESRTNPPGADLNSRRLARRAHARDGVRNPVKTIVYWMPFFNGMTTKDTCSEVP
jgi:hypothetical protein